MTFISRCSAETLKNITFFEKFGKKTRNFFHFFFRFFGVFRGNFSPDFWSCTRRYKAVSRNRPRNFRKFPGGNFGKFSVIFLSIFRKKSPEIWRVYPALQSGNLKKHVFFQKIGETKKNRHFFFGNFFFFSPHFSGGPFRETSTQHSLKPQKMVIFPENFRKFLSFSEIFGGHNFRKNGHF